MTTKAQAPSVGRIVLYTLTEGNATAINRQREDARNFPDEKSQYRGVQGHFGNSVSEGDVFPLIVTRVWEGSEGSVNGQVLLDGTDLFWATSVVQGEGPGKFAWPARS